MDFGLINPTMNKLLKTFKLDVEYTKAEGLMLYDNKGNRYLDFIAQYGAVPFGYNPPEICAAMNEFFNEGIPSMVQPSVPVKAVELAELLIKLAPGDMSQVTLCQSGAEAVETAIKLARSKTGKSTIVSTVNSFHGKTLGALSATGRQVYQEPFFAPVPGFETVPFNDLSSLEDVLSRNSDRIAAFIVEPVQGEGGIIIPAEGYLKQAEALCKKYGVLLIIDEIQTGLGRTGDLFACDRENVKPDILLLSKALGGGMIPIGACLSTKDAWSKEFGSLHSSTFANNNFTCHVSLAVLRKLTDNNNFIVDNAKEMGNYIKNRLFEISEQFPGVIKEIRGRGLMIGLEFNDFDGSESFSMKHLCEQSGFTALLAGYLLHKHHVRCAPFLNNPMTLRLQPSLIVNRAEADTALGAVADVIETLYNGHYSRLFSYLINREVKGPVKDFRKQRKPIRSSCLNPGEQPEETFAFIMHYPSIEEIRKTNTSFDEMSDSDLGKILDWEAEADAKPQEVIHMPAIKSKAGKITQGWLVGIPYSGKHLLEMPRKEAVKYLIQAVDFAKDLGARMVGLGAYTSVVTRGGADLQDRGVSITSGNSFTIATAFDALLEGARLMEIDTNRATGTVVGATGSIGRVSAMLIAEQVENLLLVGNPQKGHSSIRRIDRLAEEIYSRAFNDIINKHPDELKGISRWLDGFIKHIKMNSDTIISLHAGSPDTNLFFTSLINNNLSREGKYSSPPIIATLNINQALMNSDLVISASSSTSHLIGPEYLKPGSVVCDVARPSDVSRAVLELRSDVLVIEGGLVSYPEPICFGQNIGYEPGVNLACLSETILLSLEGDYKDFSIGSKISVDDVLYLKSLADRHGFKLARPQNELGEITPDMIKSIKKAAIMKLKSQRDEGMSLAASPIK